MYLKYNYADSINSEGFRIVLYPWIVHSFAHAMKKSTWVKYEAESLNGIFDLLQPHAQRQICSQSTFNVIYLSLHIVLMFNGAAYLKVSSGYKILHPPDDFYSCSMCFS